MALTKLVCPGGTASHTGNAIRERYPAAEIIGCLNIPAVVPLMLKRKKPGIVPIWNSHAGEVKAAEYVWNHIQQASLKITDLWPKRIEFWYVQKSGQQIPAKKTIGSVVVAQSQCSEFLKQENATFERRDLTTIALDDFRAGTTWAGVLVAEGQGEEQGLEVKSKQTANPNNFTSFATIVTAAAFGARRLRSKFRLTGISMKKFSGILGDAEHSVFDQLLGTVEDLADMPRPIFVLKRDAKVDLLFEGGALYAGELLDADELQSGGISIYEDIGELEKLYTDELKNLCATEFSSLSKADFILHRGFETYLFACPPLGLYTHGYEIEAIEPTIRYYISRIFQLWSDGVKCSPEQEEFFKRHESSWQESRAEFMEFTVVNAI